MTTFSKKISIRWSDIDPNFHMRHSAYYDFGAQHRVEILEQLGLTMRVMQKEHFGPVLFREECLFRKEIHLADQITITTTLLKMKEDASRWSIQHEFINADGKSCAVITVDGAWIDTIQRKLAIPTPTIAVTVLNGIPKAENFTQL
ncbi:acyl-CoA thioesterase [Flavobacterium sp. '19STA2R22 D10 B1']|uniref:acyl-CoA thioesterase n=1 Tax=Flavobacterium aerium TaxID=3037261 RepID=UPI00278C77F9|nr:acyl-CoA thioesterase [Flavobacterium sp. '19STA2R22 D10 B1']